MLGRFGKYELIQRIASGGMAEVYLARTHGAQGFVKELVIKRILPLLNEDPEFVSMFINEARLAARLQHANIVQIFDFDHVDGDYYLAMELVDGADLRRIQGTAARRAMPLPRTLGIHVGIEALKGLHYAHTREHRGEALGIVHRDVSPHNLLLSFAGEVKIVDFGIAKVAALHSATRTGMVKGKLTYMAPEQVRGDPVDARTDLYALGIVLWELLSGRRRYEGVGSEGELVAAARRGNVMPLGEILPGIEPELASVVGRLLQPDPGDRYASAAEALADLSRYSGATDAFEVSEYLRRLLPASAERDRRGQTELLGQGPPSVVAAAAEAPTATMGAGSEVGAAPIAGAADVARAEGVAGAQRSATPQEPARGGGRGRTWVALAFCIGVGVAAGATVSLRPAAHSADPPPIAEVGKLTLARPALIDGVSLGEGTVHGPRGQTLVLRDQRGEREIVLGRGGLHAAAPPRVDASPSDVAGRVHPQPLGGARDAGTTRRRSVGAAAASRRGRDAGPDVGSSTAPLRTGRSRRLTARGGPGSRPRAGRGQTRAHEPSSGDPARKSGFGYLAVTVTPWAWVQVDGGRPLQTPVTHLKLRAGRHTLRLFNEELKRSEHLKVAIKKDQTTKLRRKW